MLLVLTCKSNFVFSHGSSSNDTFVINMFWLLLESVCCSFRLLESFVRVVMVKFPYS